MTQPIHIASRVAGSRNPGLDGLRGLAVLLVFNFHYGGGLQSPHWPLRVFGYVTQAGWTGVVLFFALSGFLITGSLWDSRGERHVLRHFYARRALRVLPLYFLALGLTVVAGLVFAMENGTPLSQMRGLVIYFFFLQNVYPFSGWVPGFTVLPLYHMWSLAVEEQFYLVWPTLLLLARTRRMALWMSLAIGATSLVSCIGLLWVPHPNFTLSHELSMSLLTFAGALALGAGVALLERSDRADAVMRFAPGALVAGLFIYFGVSLRHGTLLLYPHSLFMVGLAGVSVAAAALVALAMRPGFAGGLFAIAPLRWMGRLSYGFYVFHILLQPLFDRIAARVASPVMSYSSYLAVRFFVAFFITLFVSWLSFRFFETPILALKRRFPMHSPLP